MATQANFAATPRLEVATISAANTNRDGTGTIVTVLAGGSSGTKVTSVTVQPVVTTTAGMVRIYISVDTGSTWNLFDEIPISAVTVSASQTAARVVRTYSDLVLPSTSYVLGAAPHNAEAMRVAAMGADL